ncbi:hypothetical protein CT0861_03728 [Colletotrichum tofieldiae]|uniref:Enoyl reductase (ER) domain-containing protein n=1 Tax=Colletotrichum tofieldiae TaxID=708197 RepID=A0A166ZE64_9PEZI|nr:hypothetical protein CT0861_03728 [Colletotrichum tofieldiae]GKT82594.1 hypothetical protein Ct61P_00444 [Colletotrichum tofieldiae]
MSRSIYLGANGQLTIKDVIETYIPQRSQALVSVSYSGVNLCDLNFFHVGLNSYITGVEFAGIVMETGPESNLKVGDAVVGVSPVCFPQPSSVGTHQDKSIVESDLTFRIPTGLDLKDAAGLTLVTQTAVDALFNVLGFGLPDADVFGTDATNKPILIWGGASSVGVAAIQLAKAAGFNPIFTTASAKNHATLQQLGATHCFDYKSPTVTEDIRAAAKELRVTLATAFDTVGNGLAIPGNDPQKTSPVLVRNSLSVGVHNESVRLVCTLPVHTDPAFGFCTSYRPAGSVGAMGSPQDPEFPARSRKIMSHLLSVLERVPRHPNVTVVKGGEAGIKEIERVAHGGASLEKVVLEHPI